MPLRLLPAPKAPDLAVHKDLIVLEQKGLSPLGGLISGLSGSYFSTMLTAFAVRR